jgi:hypothetical protein
LFGRAIDTVAIPLSRRDFARPFSFHARSWSRPKQRTIKQMSEHDKIRARLSSAIEKIKKLSEERGALDLNAVRIAAYLAMDELEIVQSMIRREIADQQRNGH